MRLSSSRCCRCLGRSGSFNPNSKKQITMLRINKVQLVGRAGKEVEVVNSKISKVSIAVQDDYKKGDEWVKQSHWFNLVFFGEQLVEKSKKIKKGDNIFVEGKLVLNSWEGANGEKNSRVEINAYTFDFVESKGSEGGVPEKITSDPIVTSAPDYDDSDMPF
jgi:single-strand DNA-binding protein